MLPLARNVQINQPATAFATIDPATNRIFVTFKDFALFFPDLGLTGVAVRTRP